MKITRRLTGAFLAILFLLSYGIGASAENVITNTVTDNITDTDTKTETAADADDLPESDANTEESGDTNTDIVPDTEMGTETDNNSDSGVNTEDTTDADADADSDVSADETFLSKLYTYGDINSENTKITLQKIGDTYTLVLPSTASPSAVTLFFGYDSTLNIKASNKAKTLIITDGKPFDLNVLCPDGDYTVTLTPLGAVSDSIDVKFLFSENPPTMYLSSDDSKNKGR